VKGEWRNLHLEFLDWMVKKPEGKKNWDNLSVDGRTT
jgi:hypothetical protein